MCRRDPQNEQGFSLLEVLLAVAILSIALPVLLGLRNFDLTCVQVRSERSGMGAFASGRLVVALAWGAAAVIVGLNTKLVLNGMSRWVETSSHPLLPWILVPAIVAVALLLLYVIVHPLLRRVSRRAEVEALGAPAAVTDRAYHRIGIALATDASDNPTLSHGLSLAKAYGAQVVLLHVSEGFGPRFFGKESDDEETREDRQYLERARSEAERLGVPAEVRLRHGSPVDEIPRHALNCWAVWLHTLVHFA